MLSMKKSFTSLMLGGFLSAFALTGTSFAEAPTVSGFIDTTYNYNFNNPFTQVNELRSFDAKANSFLINAAQLQVAGAAGDAGYVVKFLAGNDASVITSAGSGTADDFELQEAYLTYKCPKTLLNLKAGRFVTYEGIEVIESKDNPTISRGYLFGLAEAYTHTGVAVNRAFGMFDLGVGVVNGWDITSDNNSGKTIIGRLGMNFGDPLAIVLSGSHGPEQADNVAVATAPSNNSNRDSFDIVATVKMLPKTTIFLQGNWGTEEDVSVDPVSGNTVRDNWHGAGIQPVVAITDKFSLGARAEYFYDKYSSRVGTVIAPTTTDSLQNMAFTNFTITPSYKLTDTTTMRLEYRYDTSNKEVFTDDEGMTKDTASTVSVQWIQTF
jgi:hypothetical protein